MTVTDHREYMRTEEALETLTRWGRNPGAAGGENIAFSLSRQGAPGDAFVVLGDCTPFTPHGHRGILHGQPPADTGAPVAEYPLSATPVPCTFSFDLNTGKVTIAGAFPGLPPSLDFTVEYNKRFEGAGGKNLLFNSGEASDHAGYVIALELVGA
jgi:hypothetical protein